jgi:hypothetical protein|tara:strand:- start:120 stop:380 length:261 start_codon:yes stop_codon:yes gene_type:complete
MLVDKEAEAQAPPPDISGAFKFAGMLVLGILAVVGIGWTDILGLTKKSSKAEVKDDRDSVADYEKEYLDNDISEDALDEKEVGLTA